MCNKKLYATKSQHQSENGSTIFEVLNHEISSFSKTLHPLETLHPLDALHLLDFLHHLILTFLDAQQSVSKSPGHTDPE